MTPEEFKNEYGMDVPEAKRELRWYQSQLERSQDEINTLNLQTQSAWAIQREILFQMNRLQGWIASQGGGAADSVKE